MSESFDFGELRRMMIDAIVVHARTAGPETGCPELSRAVLDVMADVPRHEFVPAEMRAFAYFDTPLPIGFGKTIYSVEIIEDLARSAARRLAEQGCENVDVKSGDGSVGWAEHAPFDRILVAAAPELIPAALLSQLAPGGRMVIPAGLDGAQTLMLVTRNEDGALATEDILSVRFSALVVSD